ncbi:MAG: hypothetical protein KatS3mg003_2221 [Candidatus Nitrosocaldaceae archaeon]|nr:MAG: hypothetical protein KatS3mg003_2177 [Candidatus Nitrosocaldaceae archaeon]GIU72742.1 MAG: hypothetical protein KatS3mg003_2221 [Candidatus Nitrosocaldaceae archaeon]
MHLIPIKSDLFKDRFDLFTTIIDNIVKNGQDIIDDDILVISSKFVAMSQGSVIKLDDIIPSKDAEELANKYSLNAKIAEIVIRESDAIIGGIEGFLLAVKDGVIAPNAGVDKSNIMDGYIITHPKEPFNVAKELRIKFKDRYGINVGVVITDSRLMPSRKGTIGIAIGVSGFKPVIDLRGKKDLFGNNLRVTMHAIADSIATAANLLMGESDESIPIVIVRDLKVEWSDEDFTWTDLAIDYDKCIYIRGLRG